MKSERIKKSPLCSYLKHCGAKAILGPRIPWPDGKGYQRAIWCCRCGATGTESSNTSDETSKAQAKAKADRVDAILIVPPLRRRLRVWHVHDPKCPADAVYVGRPTQWGNPYRIGRDGTRAEVIAKHRALMLKRPMSYFAPLRGCDLSCWCWPQPCHASTYIELANR